MLIELPHLAVGSPTQIAVPGLFEVRASHSSRSRAHRRNVRPARSQALRCGRSRSTRADLIACSYRCSASSSRPSRRMQLRADQRRTAVEIFRAVRRPFEKSLVTTGGIREQLLTFFGDRRIGSGDPGQRTIELILRLHELSGDHPGKSLRLFRQRCGATMLGRVDIRLQFEDQIPDGVSARARPQLRTLQIVLEVVLVDLLTAKRSEDGGQPPQRPDETELPRHEIEQRRFARSLRDPPSSLLGFVVHVRERLSAGETMRHQTAVDPHEVVR